MKIVCAESVLCAREAFAPLGEVDILPDREISTRHLLHADALVVRSKTRITADLLRDTSVQIVATTTAGTDHMDLPALADLGIAAASAPGCNANAVAEYTLTALALLARDENRPLDGLRLGIVGHGHVGTLVADKAPALGLVPLLNDPPKAALLDPGTPDAPAYLPLADLLPQADILTLHVPLTASPAPYPTRHLVSCDALAALPRGAWLLNASRGAVVDSDALEFALQHAHVAAAVLDVWEDEPAPSPLLPLPRYLTPHIAGYSLEGLLNGTLAAYRAVCRFFELEPAWHPSLPPAPPVVLDLAHLSPSDALAAVLSAACPLDTDAAAWRAAFADAAAESATLAAPAAPPPLAPYRRAFDTFRRAYAHRREFAATPLHLLHAPAELLPALEPLGFPLTSALP
ncbi:MAG: 4-phosphoerythronate dehydrogenase [Kiritimatiellae bacterium]|nr:4-phosphoerythronate dehydrogenase [Kiritimatiellia bacterium]